MFRIMKHYKLKIMEKDIPSDKFKEFITKMYMCLQIISFLEFSERLKLNFLLYTNFIKYIMKCVSKCSVWGMLNDRVPPSPDSDPIFQIIPDRAPSQDPSFDTN